MNKKTYKQPSVEVVQLDNTYIICGSPGGPTPLKLYDDEVREDQKPESVSSDIWGTQW